MADKNLLNKHNKYSLALKVSIINKIEKGCSFHSISNQTSIDRKCLKDWKE